MGGASTRELALQLGVGLGLWAAGVAVVVRGSALLAGALLAAAGPALFLGELPLPAAGGAVLFTAALAGGATASTLACAGALFHIQRFRLVPDGLVAGVSLGVVVVWLGVLPAVTFDPSAGGLLRCPRNLLLVHGNVRRARRPRPHRHVRGSRLDGCARAAHGGPMGTKRTPVRGTAAAVGIAGAVSAGLAAAAFTHEARSGTPLLDSTTHSLWLAECVTLGILSVGVAAESDADAAPQPPHHEPGDRGRPIGRRSAGSARRQRGRPRPADRLPAGRRQPGRRRRPAGPAGPEGTVVTDVLRGREVVAQLRHAPELGPMVDRFDEAARSAGLALEHASSRARLRSELAELTASRSRIVEIGDAERRRLERDLHDGAQQRLIALSVALQRTPASGPLLTRARGEILAALDELRVLAHGIFPASLTDAGLDAALRELADSTPGSPAPRYRAALSACHRRSRQLPTAWFSTQRTVLSVTATAGRSRLRSRSPQARFDVALRMPGVDATTASLNLEHAFDRVAALDGTTSIASSDDGVIVKASVPCGS